MHDLFGIYQFLDICVQSQFIALCILNFLFCGVPLNLWNQHVDPAVVPYTDQQLVPDPGAHHMCPFVALRTHIQVIKDIWCFQAKNWLEIRNTNKALISVLLKLLPTSISSGYTAVLLNKSNRPFGVTLQCLHTMFGDHDLIEKKTAACPCRPHGTGSRSRYSAPTLRMAAHAPHSPPPALSVHWPLLLML